MSYGRESLDEHWCINIFFTEFSNFLPALALYALHCGMIVKLRDNARTTLDVHTFFNKKGGSVLSTESF